jgi:two-component system, cell cycle sensor histidine kinase and response regulator CckA
MSTQTPVYPEAELVAACIPFILAHTNDLISLHDACDAGTFLYASASFYTVLGYDPSLLNGHPGTALVHTDDLKLAREQWVALRTQDQAQATIRYRHADTTWRWMELRWYRLQQDNQTYTLVVGRDLTAYRRLETRLSHTLRLNSIGRLAAGVAHDFHNLMMGIDGCATLARAALPPDSPARDDLAEIHRSVARANSLTSQLLGFARTPTGSPTTLDLNIVITNLARLLHRLIGEDVDLTIASMPIPMRVQADRGQIEQVIMNMVVNARDAMPFGGQLQIEAHSVTLEQTTGHNHSSDARKPYVRLTITDNGIGIEPQLLARIFEPFFSTKPAGAGTGLGLAICDEIIRQHGGWVDVQSEPGQGTSFDIYLPQLVESAADQLVPTKRAPIAPPCGNETILVVEDDLSVRSVAARLLRRQGYNVISASDSDEALAVACNAPESIDLLLADLVLPKASGTWLAEQLRSHIPTLRVILMSGYPSTIVAQYEPFEAVTFLPKPVTDHGLIQTIRAVLDADCDAQPSS